MASQKGKDVAKGRFWGKINPDVLKYNQITLTANSCRVSRNISREQFVLLPSGGAGVSQVVSPGWLSTLTGYFTFLLPWIPRGWEGRAFEHLFLSMRFLLPYETAQWHQDNASCPLLCTWGCQPQVDTKYQARGFWNCMQIGGKCHSDY